MITYHRPAHPLDHPGPVRGLDHHLLPDARRPRRAVGSREARCRGASRHGSTPSTGSTSRSTSSTSPGPAGFVQGDLGPSYRFQDRTGQRHRRRRHRRPPSSSGIMAFVLAVARRDPARDLRRPRPQPLAGLPVHERSRSSASPRPASCWRSCSSSSSRSN